MTITALKRVVCGIRVRCNQPGGPTHNIVLFGILGDSNPQPQGFVSSTQTIWSPSALCQEGCEYTYKDILISMRCETSQRGPSESHCYMIDIIFKLYLLKCKLSLIDL
jgi:hypothetical protein